MIHTNLLFGYVCQTFSLRVFLSFCLNFCLFQHGVAIVYFLPMKISSSHKKLSAVSSSKWIAGELFHFSNHSKLIAFHILVLPGRRWYHNTITWSPLADHGTIIRTIIVRIIVPCSHEVKVYLLFFPVVFIMGGED